MTMQKVLIPLDRSYFSRQILPQIRRFINPEFNKLILLHVAPSDAAHEFIPTPTKPAAEYWPVQTHSSHQDAGFAKHPIYDNQVEDSLMVTVESELQEEIHLLKEAGYITSVEIRFGDPAQKILAFIEEENVDLVAMSTHGRTRASKLIFGSVAEKVMHKARVPILMIHPQEQPATSNYTSKIVV
jgi:nucleotide-binding universal stress UspA family protein